MHGCNKPKTVYICGDHVCINKSEAKQYFEDNLTLEVKVIDNKENEEINLVELNLKSNSMGEKEIRVVNKERTNKKIKVLSNDEIEKKKTELRERKKFKSKKIKKKETIKQVKLNQTREKSKTLKDTNNKEKIVNKSEEIEDICTILENCSIDEISKYLVKEGKKKKYPNISIREIK